MTAAGVLPRDGKVWFTNIPHLWLLEDADGDGVAEKRERVASGFGVRVGFLGHDLHGLRIGHDGRLYFSIGDRGASVTTTEGRKPIRRSTAHPRCELDGSGSRFTIMDCATHRMAFDQFGNLFTGDNNSDGGDPARWVHAVEGGDSGWRIGWQFLNSAPWTTRRGPWLDENVFSGRTRGASHPADRQHRQRPIRLTYYPGTGFGDRYSDMFLSATSRHLSQWHPRDPQRTLWRALHGGETGTGYLECAADRC